MLLKKLWLEEKEIVTVGEMERYCDRLRIDCKKALHSLMASHRIVRIFHGIYYIKNPEEVELSRIRYNHLELVSKGMAAKGIRNWYFGLYTALKHNNMTHEYFNVEYIVNDTISRPKPISIAGSMFRFLKFKPSLFGFGVAGDKIPYSDPEKTVLDFIYLWKYNGVPEEKILADTEEYVSRISKNKIRKYAEHYPKSIVNIVEAL